jgi:hypothetical protein
MPWTLPYPLGGLPSGQRYRYESWILRVVPPWLRRTNGGAMLRSIAAVMDALEDRAVAGVLLRFPYEDEVALAIQGREKRIVRGPSEESTVYAGRVQAWRQAHQRRGSAWELLRQWKAYNGTPAYTAGTGQPIDVIYQSGTLYRLDENGTTERTLPGWDSPPDAGWAQAWCIVDVAADPTPVSAEDDAIMGVIPRLWNAAHMLPLNVVVTWPGARLWGYPSPPLTWDAQEALYTWDDLIPHRVT